MFYIVANAGAMVWMRRRLRGLRVRTIAHGALTGLVLGAAGAAAGGGMLWLLETFIAPLATVAANGTAQTAPMIQTFAYVAVSGIVSLIVTFAPAVVLKLPEAGMLTSLARKVKR